MKVYTLAPRENWICDRLAFEWRLNNSDIDCKDPSECDVIWLLAGWCWRHINPNLLAQKTVICTIHHVVPEKFSDQKVADFKLRDQFVDAYHVPNLITRDFVQEYTSKEIFVIPYWCNDELWYPLDKIRCRKALGIDENVFVFGSFQRDTEGGTLNPKLEKGPDILCDFLERMTAKMDFEVLLGGWRREYITNRLDRSGIKYKLFELCPENVLQMMYASCDLYVVSSRFEGGPQAILECSAMKVPIISNDVGIAKSVLHEDCVVDISKFRGCAVSEGAVEYNFQQVSRLFVKSHRHAYREMMRKVNEK